MAVRCIPTRSRRTVSLDPGAVAVAAETLTDDQPCARDIRVPAGAHGAPTMIALPRSMLGRRGEPR
jgi:hypothetical protein